MLPPEAGNFIGKDQSMFGKVTAAILSGIDVVFVSAEADISDGLPGMDMVGFLSAEVKESKERIRTALKNSGVDIPIKRVTINIAPAYVKKTGSGLDLPIAVAILNALGIIEGTHLKNAVVVGELHLDGVVSKAHGVLPIVLKAKQAGKELCVVPKDNLKEASLIDGIRIIGISDLSDAIVTLNGGTFGSCESQVYGENKSSTGEEAYERMPDFSEVCGQKVLKRACEIAVSGMHNFLMIGPPGAGKSMIAQRIPSIMPKLLYDEILEVSQIYSVSGLMENAEHLMGVRPYRKPHHTISAAGLSGGGTNPRPGEVSLAHKGVLFLDELPEFAPATLEVLRQPLEEKKISISRVGYQVEYPADVLLVAAMNPCKCGYYPSPKCTCQINSVKKYLGRISKPLMDRIDISAHASQIDFMQLSGAVEEESSASIRERVQRAHRIQNERYVRLGIHFNSQLSVGMMEEFCALDNEGKKYMERVYERYALTARGYHKLLKVARTIADLDESGSIKKAHLMEAVAYR